MNELQSFLGIIDYYSSFLPNLSTKLPPPYNQLQQKGARWIWRRKQTEAFEAAKCALQDDSLLVHYDEAKPLVLACDASQYGLGAVLSHIIEDGNERSVAFASRIQPYRSRRKEVSNPDGCILWRSRVVVPT